VTGFVQPTGPYDGAESLRGTVPVTGLAAADWANCSPARTGEARDFLFVSFSQGNLLIIAQ